MPPTVNERVSKWAKLHHDEYTRQNRLKQQRYYQANKAKCNLARKLCQQRRKALLKAFAELAAIEIECF